MDAYETRKPGWVRPASLCPQARTRRARRSHHFPARRARRRRPAHTPEGRSTVDVSPAHRTQRARYRWSSTLVYETPLKKFTNHDSGGPPTKGDEVQCASLGTSGNATRSMAGAVVLSSTRVCSSFMLGNRQPPPAKASDAQCAFASFQANVPESTVLSHVSFVMVSSTVPSVWA